MCHLKGAGTAHPEVQITHSFRRQAREILSRENAQGFWLLAFWKMAELYSNYKNQSLKIPVGLGNEQCGKGKKEINWVEGVLTFAGHLICAECPSRLSLNPHRNRSVRQILIPPFHRGRN